MLPFEQLLSLQETHPHMSVSLGHCVLGTFVLMKLFF